MLRVKREKSKNMKKGKEQIESPINVSEIKWKGHLYAEM